MPGLIGNEPSQVPTNADLGNLAYLDEVSLGLGDLAYTNKTNLEQTINLDASRVTTGTFPAVSGANLTNLNASNLASGTVPAARLNGVLNVNTGGTAPYYGARAVVNFYYNGTNTVTNFSGNVLSVTRNAVGVYVLTFSVNMPISTYVVTGSACGVGTNNVAVVSEDPSPTTAGQFVLKTTSQLQIVIRDNDTDTNVDPTVSCNVVIYA